METLVKGRNRPQRMRSRTVSLARAKRARRITSQIGKRHSATLVDSLEPDDAVVREFIADLYAAMSMMRLLRQEIATALSLSSAEYSVLLAVWYLERQGEMTVRAISDHLHVAAAYVTSEVARLTNKGLLIKRADPRDRRAVEVALTKAARDTLLKLGPMLRQINKPLLLGMHYRDLATVQRFLRSVIEHGYEAIAVAESFIGHQHAGRRRQAHPIK
jgi:DNA-binding MarR family transcriptional regulator